MSIPMSRAAMQGLKAQKDEEQRIREQKIRLDKVKQIANSIYNSAVQLAATSTHTSFKHEIPRGLYNSLPPNHRLYTSDPFYLNNMTDILAELQALFPGCSVTHALMAKGRDGKLYDLSKMDDSVLPFIDQTLEQSYILIDWS
jgi:hypothetical protein